MVAIDFNNPGVVRQDGGDMPNYTGRSQGTGGIDFSGLFEGIGKAYAMGVDAKAQSIERDIEKKARGIWEGTNKEFGFDPPKTIPPGMQDGVEQMATLQGAFEQGKISEVDYWGRLATNSKRLREQYPGFENEVDAAIQTITGTRPANAYRDALLGQMKAEQDAISDAHKAQRSFEDKNGDWITLVAPDYFDNPDKYDFEKVRAGVFKSQSVITRIEAEKKQLELNKAQGEQNDKQVERVASQDFNFVVQSTITKAFDTNSKSFSQQLEEFSRGGMNPADLDAFLQNADATEVMLRQALLAKGRTEYGQYMTQEQINKLVDAAMAPVTEAKKAIVGGDYKGAARALTVTNAIDDFGLKKMYEADPAIAVGGGLAKVNKMLGERFINENSKLIGVGSDSTAIIELYGQIMNGKTDAVKEVIGTGSTQLMRTFVNAAPEIIQGMKSGGPEFSSVIKGVFGKADGDFWKEVKSDNRITLYTKWLDPEISKKIKQFGSEEDWRLYQDWAVGNFFNIPQFRLAAGDLEGADIKFDEKTRRFSLVKSATDYAQMAVPVKGAMATYSYYTQIEAVNQLNAALSVLEPIFELSGGNVNEDLQTIINQLNIKLDSGDQGFWGKVLGAVKSVNFQQTDMAKDSSFAMSDLGFDKEKVTVSGEATASEDVVSDVPSDHRQKVRDMIGKAEGADYNTIFSHAEKKYGVNITDMTIAEIQTLQKRMSANLGSSAVGKYQIIYKTLANAVEKLGISPDTKFTPEVQDRLADFLMDARGYQKWTSGKMDSGTFLNNMAQEWASIPTTAGKSFYEGDKMGNSATQGGMKLASLISG